MFAREDKLFTLIIQNLSGTDFPSVMKGNFKPGKTKLDSKMNEVEYMENLNGDNQSVSKSEFAKPVEKSGKNKPIVNKNVDEDYLCENMYHDNNVESKEDENTDKNSENRLQVKGEKSVDENIDCIPKIRAVS